MERQIARRLEAVFGPLLQTVQHHPLERHRERRRDLRERRRVFAQNRGQRLGGRLAQKRARPGQHLVKDAAEREDVRSMVGLLSSGLLGRHVSHRAENGSRIRLCDSRRRVRQTAIRRLDLCCQTEVEDLDPTVGRDEEVLGLDVAMRDPLVVRGCETGGDLARVLDGFTLRKCTSLQPPPQCLALEQFRHRVRGAMVRAQVENREDVGMREGGHGLGLPLEPREAVRVAREEVGEDFDRNITIQLRVARPIDLAHPPGADLVEDVVDTEARAAYEGQVAGLYGPYGDEGR